MYIVFIIGGISMNDIILLIVTYYILAILLIILVLNLIQYASKEI